MIVCLAEPKTFGQIGANTLSQTNPSGTRNTTTNTYKLLMLFLLLNSSVTCKFTKVQISSYLKIYQMPPIIHQFLCRNPQLKSSSRIIKSKEMVHKILFIARSSKVLNSVTYPFTNE